MAKHRDDPLYEVFIREKARLWRDERVRLTEKDFLDTVDPTRSHSDDAAKNYIEKLRTGQWRSSSVRERAEQENTSAGLYNVILADGSGQVVSSANVQLPLNRSLLDAYKSGDLHKATEKYLERQYENKTNIPLSQRREMGIQSTPRKNMRGLKIVGIKRLHRTRKRVEIVRRQK